MYNILRIAAHYILRSKNLVIMTLLFFSTLSTSNTKVQDGVYCASYGPWEFTHRIILPL